MILDLQNYPKDKTFVKWLKVYNGGLQRQKRDKSKATLIIDAKKKKRKKKIKKLW